MFPLGLVLWLICLSSTSGDNFMSKLFAKGSNGKNLYYFHCPNFFLLHLPVAFAVRFQFHSKTKVLFLKTVPFMYKLKLPEVITHFYRPYFTGPPTSLTNSAIGMWMQRSGLARRVCQRMVSVHSYDSSKYRYWYFYRVLFVSCFHNLTLVFFWYQAFLQEVRQLWQDDVKSRLWSRVREFLSAQSKRYVIVLWWLFYLQE